jgi:hypothetical protein
MTLRVLLQTSSLLQGAMLLLLKVVTLLGVLVADAGLAPDMEYRPRRLDPPPSLFAEDCRKKHR